MENKLRTFQITYACLFALALTLFVTFIVAFFSPSKSVIIHVNRFGEAEIELVLLSIITFFSVIGFGMLKKIRVL